MAKSTVDLSTLFESAKDIRTRKDAVSEEERKNRAALQSLIEGGLLTQEQVNEALEAHPRLNRYAVDSGYEGFAQDTEENGSDPANPPE